MNVARTIAEVRGGDVKLYSRNRLSFDQRFAPIAEALAGLGHDAVLDGEVVAVDDVGRSSFQLLQNYQRSGQGRLAYYVFDLLHLAGHDLRRLQLRERKAVLAKLVADLPRVQLSEHVEGRGVALFRAAAAKGLEGIVAKKLSGPYQAGKRDFNWIKLKRSYQQSALADTVDVVVVGFDYGQGRRAKWGVGSLLCAVYDPATDTFPTVTRCASGLSDAGWVELGQRLAQDRIEHPDPRVRAILKPDVWVVPRYV